MGVSFQAADLVKAVVISGKKVGGYIGRIPLVLMVWQSYLIVKTSPYTSTAFVPVKSSSHQTGFL